MDIFNAGLILFQILSGGFVPFAKSTIDDPIFKFVQEDMDEEFWQILADNGCNMIDSCDQEVRDLIFMMISAHPECRPSAIEVI